MKLLGAYKNGDYTVHIFDNGTKIRKNDKDSMTPSTIESMDLKITNCCDMGCVFCHENSNPNGKHADLFAPSFLDKLHPFTEIAIGGGNPLEHPELLKFLMVCKQRKFIPSMTVNQIHFEKQFDFIKQLVDANLIYGLGVSLVNPTDEFIAKVKQITNAVIHIINGIITEQQLEALKNKGLKILVLGYKVFRRGENLYSKEAQRIDFNKAMLYNKIRNAVNEGWFEVVSFDNLALEQLDVKNMMPKEEWEEFYLGDDGIGDDFNSASMYVDLVERKFAKNSCSTERFDLLDTAEDMFNFLRGK